MAHNKIAKYLLVNCTLSIIMNVENNVKNIDFSDDSIKYLCLVFLLVNEKYLLKLYIPHIYTLSQQVCPLLLSKLAIKMEV